MPVLMGPEMFGYWQIYYLYFAYLNFLGLGYNDGIVLFYGGKKYEELPLKTFRSASAAFSIQNAIITSVILVSVSLLATGHSLFIYSALAVNIPLSCLQFMILSVFLATGKIAFYNIINLITRLLTVSLYIVLLIQEIYDFHYIIIVDVCARIVITVICLIYAKELFIWKNINLRLGFAELKEKESAGFKITIGLLAGSFIVAIGRIVIEQLDSVSAFGIYSFAVALISIVTTFTTVAGMVLFPFMKRYDDTVIVSKMPILRFTIDFMIFFALLLYIPLVIIITRYMPAYEESLEYLPILLASAVPLGQNQILVLTYYKAFRLEKKYLLFNLLFLAIMGAATFLVYFLTHSILLIAVATTAIIFIWNLAIDNSLIKTIGAPADYKNRITAAIMLLIFVLSAGLCDLLFFAIIYVIALCIHTLFNKRLITSLVKPILSRHRS